MLESYKVRYDAQSQSCQVTSFMGDDVFMITHYCEDTEFRLLGDKFLNLRSKVLNKPVVTNRNAVRKRTLMSISEYILRRSCMTQSR